MNKIVPDRRRVYVAGPVGAPDDGRISRVETALAVGSRLMRLGFEPFVPHVIHWWDERHPQDYERWLQYDFEWIAACAALLRIPGHSPGADREVAFMQTVLCRPVFFNEGALLCWGCDA